MKGPIVLYKKLFLDCAVPFGLFMGLMVGLKMGWLAGLYTTLVGGAFFGFFMALILGGLHHAAVKNLTAEYGKNLLNLHQVKMFGVQQSVATAFDACVKALEQVKGCRIKSQDKSTGAIEARMGSNWDTFGEKILVVITPADAMSSKISISSEPVMSTVVVDYGKNAKNVQAVLDALKAQQVPLTGEPVIGTGN